MIKKTTSSESLILNNKLGFTKVLILIFALLIGSATVKCAELAGFSWSSSGNIAKDTTILTFSYQIVTPAPAMVLYVNLPAASNTQWLILDSVKVKINGTPAAIDAGSSEATGKSLKVVLSNPALATAGASVEVTAYAINGTVEGNFSWGFIRTATIGGTAIDQVTSPAAFVLIPPIPANLPPNAATNVTDSSFTMSWDAIQYAYGYRVEVSTNNIFTAYVPGYSNLEVGYSFSIEVSGLSPNTNYYFRIRAYNTTGISDYSPWLSTTTTKKKQTISFSALDPVEYGSADFNLTATASSGLAVTYSSSDLGVATVTGTLVHVVGVGTTDITASQAGNTQYYAAADVIQELIVDQKKLTLTGLTADSKVYDNLTDATVSDYGTLTGIVGAEIVTLNSASASASFADEAVGAAKVVTVTGLVLEGADMANYTIDDQTTTADITTKSISLQRMDVNDKIYDGTTDATISDQGVLIDVIGGDIVDVSTGAAVLAFVDKNVADSIEVPISGVTLTGADKDNYSLDSIYSAYGNITAKTLTITANDDQKDQDMVPYSGGNGVVYSGFIAGEDESVLTGTLSYGGTSQGATEAGTFTIIPQGLTAQNYSIVYMNGSLTIGSVGINDEILMNPVTYPNPFINTIYVKNAEMVSQIRINNLVGQQVAGYVNNGSANISILTSELKQGVYIIVIETTDGKHYTEKLVKK